MTLLAEGNSLKDGSNVLAKIAPAHSNGSVCLEREAHMYVDQLSFLGNTHPKSRLTKLVTRPSAALQLIDIFNIDRENGDVLVLLLSHPGPNLLGRYFPQGRINDLLLPVHHSLNTADSAVNSSTFKESGSETEEDAENVDVMDLASFIQYVRHLNRRAMHSLLYRFAIEATHCLEQVHKENLSHRESEFTFIASISN